MNESLPVSINHQTVQQSSSVKQIANHLNALDQKDEHKPDSVRFTLPGNFSIIKKVLVDDSIPAENLPEMVLFEFEKSVETDARHYQIYLPDSVASRGNYREFFAIGIRKEVLEFFNNIIQTAQFDTESITPNCFPVDEFFRKLHPDIEGEILLLGWQRRGLDTIILDKENFINYTFRPYNANFNPIDQIDEEELLSGFDGLLEAIKHPAILDQPLYDIRRIYLYGIHFKAEWLEMIKAQINIPVQLFNLNQPMPFTLKTEEEFSADRIYQYIESVSNIF